AAHSLEHGTGSIRDVHSFPTRRSSDLECIEAPGPRGLDLVKRIRDLRGDALWPFVETLRTYGDVVQAHLPGMRMLLIYRPQRVRSEGHTSELQSRVDLVCRLLLEKKHG